MKQIIICLIFFQIIFTQSFSNFSFSGSKSIGMAGAVVSNVDDAEAMLYNPSGLVDLDKYSVILGSSDLYDLRFLNHQFIAISLPNNFALSFQEFSTDSKGIFSSQNSKTINLSSEEVVSISQGIRLLNDANSTLSIGYNLNALVFYQAGSAGPNGDGTFGLPESKSTSIGIDIGINASLREKITFGAFIKNINNPSIKKGSSQSHFPRRMDLGITYNPFDDLYTTFAFQRTLGKDKTSFRFGVEYDLTDTFTLRSGIQMNPNRLGFGISYSISNVELSYSLLTHSILSTSSVISIGFNFE
tara:strand:+ start:3152 stop:4054 length:903 start_codon:yes stop_codon:yes gene_type:complete